MEVIGGVVVNVDFVGGSNEELEEVFPSKFVSLVAEQVVSPCSPFLLRLVKGYELNDVTVEPVDVFGLVVMLFIV